MKSDFRSDARRQVGVGLVQEVGERLAVRADRLGGLEADAVVRDVVLLAGGSDDGRRVGLVGVGVYLDRPPRVVGVLHAL